MFVLSTFSFPTSNLPTSCQKLSLSLFFSSFSCQEQFLSFLPYLCRAFQRKLHVFIEGEKPENQVIDGQQREWRTEAAAYFTHVLSLVLISRVTLTHTVGYWLSTAICLSPQRVGWWELLGFQTSVEQF